MIRKGQLIVENHITSNDAVFIMSPVPEFRRTEIDKIEIAAALNLSIDSINSNYEMQIVNAGLETLIVPIKTLHSILNLSPELGKSILPFPHGFSEYILKAVLPQLHKKFYINGILREICYILL